MISPSDILKAGILLVDDQEENISLLNELLRGAGYVSISSTTNPHSVTELYRKNRYSLVVLDLEMPGLDGFGVMEALKQVETDGYLPVLVITGHPDHRLRALKAGARDFITRPFDVGEVLARVHQMIEVRLLHLEAQRLKEEAEAQSLKAQRDLAQLLTHSPAVLYTLLINDRTVTPVVVSESMKRLLGYGVEEASHYGWWVNSVHPDDRERVLAAVGQDSPQESCTLEYRIRHKNGSYRWVQDCKRVVSEETKEKIAVGVWFDISDKKMAEEARQASEARLNFALKKSHIGAWEMSLPDHAICRTPIYDAIFGHDKLLPFWSYELFLEHVLHEDREAVDRGFGEAIAASRNWNCECRIRRSDGVIRWISMAGSHERDSDGKAVRLSGIVQDISKQKRAEQESQNQLRELLRWQEALIGREDRVLELKTEVNELLARQALPARYSPIMTP